MGFESVRLVVGFLARQPHLQPPKEFEALLKCWPEVVGPVAMAHTRPQEIERCVLKVATKSASWANQLTFKRVEILLSLNERLGLGLVDIRFSAGEWYRKRESFATATEQVALWEAHPCRVDDTPARQSLPATQDARMAFQRWAELMRSRSAELPICQKCNCSAPGGEIERWGVCAICAAKRWSDQS